MKKVFRVIYPFFIYIAITNLVAIGGMLLYTLWFLVTGSGMDFREAFYTGTAIVVNQSVYLTALAAAVTAVILFAFYRMDCIGRGRLKNTALLIPGGWIYLVLIGISICIVGNNFIEMVRLSDIFPGYDEVADVLYSIPFPAQLLCIGLMIPIAEEMVFRVLGFRRLRDTMSFLPAALWSAVLFGCFHGNMVQGIYAFLLGFVIAYAYELSDNPFAPICVHCCANLVSVILTALPESMSSPGFTVMAVELSGFFGITAYSLIKLKQYSRPQKAAASEEVNT